MRKHNSARLREIANYLEETDVLADIGCDHGYLAILAFQKNIKFVQLIDNKPGPLAVAKANLQGVKNVEFTLASGLSQLNSSINTASLCGMGGLLVIDILKENLKVAQELNKIIIQVNSDIDQLRAFLMSEKFMIITESIIAERDKFYEIIVCKYSPFSPIYYTDKQLLFGPILLEQKTGIFLDKWEKMLKKYHQINNSNFGDKQEISKKIALIEEVLS